MKTLVSKKIIALIFLTFLAGGAGAFLYKSQTDNLFNKEENQAVDLDEKLENGEPATTNTSTTVPATPKVVPSETDVSTLGVQGGWATGQKNVDTGEVEVTIYFEGSGAYTIQEKTASGWTNKIENIFYPGSGGLKVATLGSTQPSITIRGLKNVNGQYTSATKEFVITRAEVEAEGGLKTYN